MKTFAIITGVVLLALTGLFGYKTINDHSERKAMVKALEDLRHAVQINTVWRRPLLGPPIKTVRVSQFILSLSKIDTKDCPPAFRAAWINYVQSYERTRDLVFLRQQDLLERNTKLAIRAELVGQIGGAYESEHTNNLIAAKHLARIDHEEKLLSLERVAFRYGIDSLRHEAD